MATRWSAAHHRRRVARAATRGLPMYLGGSRAAERDPVAGDASPRIGPQRWVLVVEDDPLVAELLVDLLTGRGYVVRTTNTALGVLARARRERPSAILLDLGLPYRSGATLLVDLKADRHTASIPVIVVSAFTETLSPGRAALAAAVLPKPFDTWSFFDAVDAACA